MDFGEWIASLTADVKTAEGKQRELRAHIDEEFIDINQYMLELVESVGEQKR